MRRRRVTGTDGPAKAGHYVQRGATELLLVPGDVAEALVVGLHFVHRRADAFADAGVESLPAEIRHQLGWNPFVEFRGAHPRLRVVLRIVECQLQLQRVRVDLPPDFLESRMEAFGITLAVQP